MDLSISQVQNVLRTYQKQVREEKVRAVFGVREDAMNGKDRLDISREGRSRLEEKKRHDPDSDIPPGR